MDYYKEISDAIETAEFVLVGLGEEMQFDWRLLEADDQYNRLIEQIDDNAEYESLVAYLQRFMIQKYADKDDDIFEILSQKLAKKNYFIVSLTIDDQIYRSSLLSERVVTPCGGFRKIQCPDCCTSDLWEPDKNLMEMAERSYQSGMIPEKIHKSICPQCGKELVFNQMGNGKYCEEGYLDQWNKYMKWLQGTMNRNVCLVELGVGMQFPSVIRWPFEKMVMYNLKAKMFRIHPVLFQMEDEIRERAIGIQADAKEFVRNWKCDGR